MSVCAIQLNLVHYIYLQNFADDFKISFFFWFIFEFDAHFCCSRDEIEKVSVIFFKRVYHIAFLSLHLRLVELLFEFFIWFLVIILIYIYMQLLTIVLIKFSILNNHHGTCTKRSVLLQFNFDVFIILIFIWIYFRFNWPH